MGNWTITGNVILEPLNRIIPYVPNILLGIVIFLAISIVGYFIASLFGWLVKKFFYKINLDKKLRKMDLGDSLGNMSIAKVAGLILKWYIFIVFFNQAVYYLNLGRISEIIMAFARWLPKLITSITIIITGLLLIDFIIHKILEIKSKFINAIAAIIKAVLIIVIIFTAIEQLGIKTALAQNVFLMIIGAILITGSLALGIGLGLSLKDEFKPLVKKIKKKL